MPDDDRRDRPSWREIDRRKDRSKHLTEDRLPENRSNSMKSQMNRYKKSAEELLFSDQPQESAKEAKAREALHKKFETPAFDEAARKFLDKYGVPKKWETLSLMLDSSDHLLIGAALEGMANLYEAQSPSEQLFFRNSLKIIKRKSPNKEIVEKAKEILKKAK